MRSIEVGGDFSARLAEMARHRTRAVAALGVIACLGIGGVVLARGAPASIAPPARAEETAAPASISGGSVVIVHVAGAVKRPGLYELSASARVADAIEAAGGSTRRADLDSLNLAQIVVDGIKIEVPVRGAGASSALASPSASIAPGVVNINTADQVLLETIPGIGPVTAAAIITHRTEIGGFSALEQLLDVSGIGPATFEAIRSYVTL